MKGIGVFVTGITAPGPTPGLAPTWSAAPDGSVVGVCCRAGVEQPLRSKRSLTGMFPGASEPVGGAGTWANRTKKRAGMNQGQLKYAEMQLIPLGKNNPNRVM